MRLIDADVLKKHKFFSANNPNATRVYDETTIAYKRGWNDAIDEIIDNAPTVEERPQVVIFSENMTAEEKQKLIAEFKAVMDNAKFTIEPERPQGEWIDICTLPIIRKCSICGNEIGNEMGFYNNFCPNCGAEMRGDT